MPAGHRPLVYFWIAEYKNGKALPQFDPQTGHENKFDLVDIPKLKSFGWYPFPPKFANKVWQSSKVVCVPSTLPVYTLILHEGKKLIAYRDQTVKSFSFRVCGKCKHKWQFTTANPDMMVGLPVSSKTFDEFFEIQDERGKHTIKYCSAICPKCGYHDTNAVMIKDKLVKQYASEVRSCVYVLGEKGGQIKRIKEDGTFICG